MAFVNEYVSQEDIKKYRLDEKFLRRHPEYTSLPSDFQPSWTINRERNVYLMATGMANPVRETESWFAFMLNWDGKEFSVKLERGPGVECHRDLIRLGRLFPFNPEPPEAYPARLVVCKYQKRYSVHHNLLFASVWIRDWRKSWVKLQNIRQKVN